jgi:hypothetical protein
MKTPTLVLFGGTGFLGKVVQDYFEARGWKLIIVTRQDLRSSTSLRRQVVRWDGRNVDPTWAELLEGADVVLNLAGRTVNCRYNRKNREAIMLSRTESTRAVGEAIARCKTPPALWLNASTATIYQHTFGPPHDEQGAIKAEAEAKDAFSVDVAQAWEAAARESCPAGTRLVLLRLAMVLGEASNSVFPTLRRLAKLGLGGKMGHGHQFVSWIHELDFCRALEWIWSIKT